MRTITTRCGFRPRDRLGPELAAAYSSRGSVWIQKGEHDKVDADFQQAIAFDPGMARPSSWSGTPGSRILRPPEEFDEAVSRATEAIELDEDCLPAYAIRAGRTGTRSIGRSDRRLYAADRAERRRLSRPRGAWPGVRETGRIRPGLGRPGPRDRLGNKPGGRGPPRPAWPTPATATPLPWPLGPAGRSPAGLRRSLQDAPTTPGCTTTAAWFSTTSAATTRRRCFRGPGENRPRAPPPKKHERAQGFLRRFAKQSRDSLADDHPAS